MNAISFITEFDEIEFERCIEEKANNQRDMFVEEVIDDICNATGLDEDIIIAILDLKHIER